mgnify:FL=1
MGTKTKVAIVLFILQIVSVAGQVLSTNGGNFLGAVASALGLCVFTIIGIILVCLDNRKKESTENKEIHKEPEERRIGFSDVSKSDADEETDETAYGEDDEEYDEDDYEEIKDKLQKKYVAEEIVKVVLAILTIAAFAVLIVGIIVAITQSI